MTRVIPKKPGPRTGETILQANNSMPLPFYEGEAGHPADCLPVEGAARAVSNNCCTRREGMRIVPLLLIALFLFGCASSGEVSQVKQDVTSVYTEQTNYMEKTDARLSRLEKE